MYKFKYKEKDHAEKMLEEGFTSKHIASELKILAKYYRSIGISHDNIKDLLCKFCEKHLNGYKYAIHFKIINNAVKYVEFDREKNDDKNKLIQIDFIDVSNKEIEYINDLDLEQQYKKVIFTFLIMDKLNKKYSEINNGKILNKEYFFGGYGRYRDLVRLSHITFNKRKKSQIKNIHDLIRLLDEKGLVEIIGNGNIKLNFMYELQESDDIALKVENFNTIGLYYGFYHGEKNVKKCEGCGLLIKAKSNRKKYCDECWVDREKEIKRETWHKNKNKYRH